jgi:hypothetical protein
MTFRSKSDILHALRALPMNERVEVIGEMIEEMQPTEIVDTIKDRKLSREVEEITTRLVGSSPAWQAAQDGVF